MSNFVRSRLIYKSAIILAVATMLILLIVFPFIFNRIAPPLTSWSYTFAWLIATGVGVVKYALDEQAAHKAQKPTHRHMPQTLAGPKYS